MSRLSALSCALTLPLAATAGAWAQEARTATPGAQLSLQGKLNTATTWGTVISVPALGSLDFRWQWTGSPVPLKGVWQLSTAATPPAGVDLPAGSLAAQGPIQQISTSAGQWTGFTIAPSVHLASVSLPSTFHVRVRAESGRTARVSNWVRVGVGQTRVASQPPVSIPSPRENTPTKADFVLPDLRCEGLLGWVPRDDPIVPFDFVSNDGGTLEVQEVPPDLEFHVDIANGGHSSATFAVSFNSTIAGVRDIASLQMVTLAAGKKQSLRVKSDRETEWKWGENRLWGQIVLDVNNHVKETNEANNQCSLSFLVTASVDISIPSW